MGKKKAPTPSAGADLEKRLRIKTRSFLLAIPIRLLNNADEALFYARPKGFIGFTIFADDNLIEPHIYVMNVARPLAIARGTGNV